MEGKTRNIARVWCCLTAVLFLLASGLEAAELLRPREMKSTREMTVKSLPFKKVAGDNERIVAPLQKPVKTPTEKAKGPLYREGEVLVIFKKSVKARAVNMMLSKDNLTIKKKFQVLSRIRGKEYALIKAKDMKAVELIKLLRKSPLVEKVSLNYAKQLNVVPNDTDFNDQWSLNNTGQDFYPPYFGTPDADIDAPEAWDIQTGSEDVVVAVLDTGVDYLHPDLDDNMWVNQAEAGGAPGVDDDGNGYVDDIYGIDTGEVDTDPMDIHGHGTHVAGTIAAEGNNSLGVAGVNWNAGIMAVKGFTPDGYMYTDAELEALDYIIAMKQAGVNIVAINASYGCYDCFDQIQKDAIEAAGDEGIIFVAAAGNAGTDNDTAPHYPASYDSSNIVSVAATDWNDGLACFSNYGLTSVDLGAPGHYVLSTYSDIWYTPGVGDPFFDDMESGSGNWSAEGTWAITEEEALSATHAWSDSPGGNYVENTEYALTSNPIDLSGASGSLSLGFAVKYELDYNWDYLDIYYKAPPSPSLWAITDEKAYSGTHAWSDSPGGNYPDDARRWLISPIIDVSGADSEARVRFRITGRLEQDYDYLKLYMSRDGGATWSTWYYSYSGDMSSGWEFWGNSIPAEYRTAQFRFAFLLLSDSSVNYDGYYIDNVEALDQCTTFFFDDMESGMDGWETQDMPMWNYAGYITGDSGGDWYLYNVPISDKYFWDQFQVKFVLYTDYSINRDGVYLDDIGIGTPEIDHAYGFMSGTSMAAPHVSGAAALMAAEYPGESPDDRIQRILSGADPLASLAGKVVTDGRLNLYNSLLAVEPCEGDFDDDGDVDGSDLAVFAADFGRTNCANPSPCKGDFDDDGDVDGSDLAVFAADFGRTDCLN